MKTKLNYTEKELKFKELHSQLLKLNEFELADELSTVFYQYGTECYKHGIEMMRETYNL